MIDRKQAPYISELFIPSLLPHFQTTLPNGIELVCVHDSTQEVFKADIVFEAGAWSQPQPLIASTTLNMLNEGTTRHNAEGIADTFDYYGAYVDFNCGMHKSELNLISLNKYAPDTIAMVAEMVQDSIFPEKELETYLRNRRQKYLVDIEKTSYLARQEFTKLLFGDHHPYANAVADKNYTSVSRQQLQDFYTRHISNSKCRIILSGNVSDIVLQEIEKTFCSLRQPQPDSDSCHHVIQPYPAGRYDIPKADTVQASIRIGKKGVHITDKDYAGFQLLNTIFGGYFGSRLMSNIREEKGYTYGISSFNVSLPLSSYWCISTDVNNKHTEATIDEVFKEIRTLQTELIPDEELELVKSYFHGELLRELDGVFSQADALKHKLNYGMDNQFYISIINRIKNCTGSELRELANKYMNLNELYIVIAGNE